MKIHVFATPLRNGCHTLLMTMLALSLLISPLSMAQNTRQDLTKKIQAIESKSHSTIGITAILIEKNQIVSHNGNVPFFMASTVKVPIAVTFLHRIDQKKDSLERVVKLDAKNSVPGSGSLYHLFEKNGMNMSLKQIMKHMLVVSDNSASDTLLHEIYGPQAVKQRMSDLGFKDMRINRSILEIMMDTNAVDHALLKKPRPVFAWKKQFNSVPLKNKVAAWKRFQSDMRDTTTPNDMAQLLVKLYKRQALSESSTNLLMMIMEQCRSGRNRIRGLLPANVKVAHKTGTWTISEQNYLNYPGSKQLFQFASDVGIITLPKNKGHVAIAVYVKSKGANNYARSRAIALTSRAIYDHFMGQ